MGNIYIYSEPIRSGKTTAVMNWLKKKPKQAAGFLTPDVDGKRKLFDIAADQYIDFEKDEQSCPDHTRIGNFIFDNAVFRQGQELLLNASINWPKWLIVDEIGKLEMERKEGWEPAVSQVIKLHNNIDCQCDMLLVVRDHLLNEAIMHYGLHAAMVLDKRFFLL